jgi:hypothetical protein
LCLRFAPQARGDNALVTLPNNRMLVMGGETDTAGHDQVGGSQGHPCAL